MSRSVLPFDASQHAAADVLLPFYVNETLRGEELEFVRAHVQSCEQCQREVEWLRTIYGACAASPTLQAAAARSVPDTARELVDGGRADPPIPRVVDRWRAAQPWTRWLIAAQLAAIAVLGALLYSDTREAPNYRTLGAQQTSIDTPDAVAVMFDPSIREADLRRILHGVEARIVDGPSSTDVFLLEIPAQRTDQALKALRAEPGVRLAERLGPRTGR